MDVLMAATLIVVWLALVVITLFARDLKRKWNRERRQRYPRFPRYPE